MSESCLVKNLGHASFNECVSEAMDDWVKDVEYLTQPTNKDGRYYCSKSDCEGVRFPTPDEVSKSTHK